MIGIYGHILLFGNDEEVSSYDACEGLSFAILLVFDIVVFIAIILIAL
jgi:hypothetical protein